MRKVRFFHGRIKDGRASLGALSIEYPQSADAREREAAIYFRPHELEIRRDGSVASSFRARVERSNAAGAVARVHLQTENGQSIQVDLPLELYHELPLKVDEQVFVYPKQARVFVPDYAI